MTRLWATWFERAGRMFQYGISAAEIWGEDQEPKGRSAMKAKLKIAEIYADEPKANRERRQNTFVHGFVILTQILMERIWTPKS